jgi:CHAT domain-containing protein
LSGHRFSRFRFAWVGVLLLLIPLQDTRLLSAKAEYAHAHQIFLHGYLEKSQLEAAQGYGRFLGSDPEWASKFQLLEARAMVARGMSEDTLRLLSAQPSILNTREEIIEKLTLEGVAFTSLHQFDVANQKLTEAQSLCVATFYTACGGVPLRRGLLATHRGRIAEAQQLFLDTLSIARKHEDRWLESAALLNLGYTYVKSEQFDEAVDWLVPAHKAAVAIDAADQEQIASGNLGWAYFKLGDADRALELFLEAEKDAATLGDLPAEINWMTTAGYLYTRTGEIQQARQSYQHALLKAREINSKQDISDILTDLALVALATGKPDEADTYADQSLAMARQSGSRPDMLDAMAIQMQAAALRGDSARAQQLLQEVEVAPESQASMKWASEDAIAKLYESQGHASEARSAYQSALNIFEAARAKIHLEDLQLPFIANAKSIYDDYIHFLAMQGKTEEALVTADQSRARNLAQGFGQASSQRALSPAGLPPRAVARKAGATLLFYWLGEKQSYLWAITPEKTTLFALPAQREITPLIERYRKVLLGTQDPVESGNTTGQQLYSMLVAPAAKLLRPGVPVMVLTDGALSQLNFETLIVPGAASGTDTTKSAERQPHYWIEDATLAAAPSLAMLAAAKPVRETNRNLLLLGDAISPGEGYSELPFASIEMQQIERHFAAHDEVVFARGKATPSAYLGSDPAHFSYIHFVSHGVASRTDPLDSAIILSRGGTPAASATGAGEDSFKLYAREVMRHPIDARLVTISACYGSGTRTYTGEGLVGLSWAFLRAGAHNVVGALWEADDESSPQLMDSMYQGLQEGKRPDEALRGAKLALLHSTNKFRKAYYWAPFQIYTRL